MLVGDSPDGGRCVPRRWECLLVPDAYIQTDPDGGQGAKDQCGGAVVLANQSSQDKRHDVIALNINYLDSPTGLQKH